MIGITGGVGSRLARSLQHLGDTVSGLARRAAAREELWEAGIDARPGDLTTLTSAQLAQVTGDVDAVAFTAGAGGTGDTATIDRDGVGKAIEAARLNGIDRRGLVSVFPAAWRERNPGAGLDHYIAMKKDADVALTQSGLDWIILRPAVLLDGPGRGAVALGPAQIHGDITRQDVADTGRGRRGGQPRPRPPCACTGHAPTAASCGRRPTSHEPAAPSRGGGRRAGPSPSGPAGRSPSPVLPLRRRAAGCRSSTETRGEREGGPPARR
ncbi:NAD(P)H-binding protein [Blastococcus brunescens]|uniref:NAD(P)H-binding protein n=1 Tax=Blastococcus brunescens TaxID=1564165 RepID=A0ABZ1BA94_9ACTN|nr:NAD(P)H-binding protein [Blastococcus sp. BMG 8361]WRL66998.1 NAD(P)H-binding protein [Blastococcus sp. BMG 8361]